jgi:hypothetical protein
VGLHALIVFIKSLIGLLFIFFLLLLFKIVVELFDNLGVVLPHISLTSDCRHWSCFDCVEVFTGIFYVLVQNLFIYHVSIAVARSDIPKVGAR